MENAPYTIHYGYKGLSARAPSFTQSFALALNLKFYTHLSYASFG